MKNRTPHNQMHRPIRLTHLHNTDRGYHQFSKLYQEQENYTIWYSFKEENTSIFVVRGIQNSVLCFKKRILTK